MSQIKKCPGCELCFAIMNGKCKYVYSFDIIPEIEMCPECAAKKARQDKIMSKVRRCPACGFTGLYKTGIETGLCPACATS